MQKDESGREIRMGLRALVPLPRVDGCAQWRIS